MIETSQLQTLLAVARAKSFSKAAGELSVTQSAISQSIKNLENKVAVKIFKRSGKQVVLTGEGQKLYQLAENFITQMDSTLNEIQFDKKSMSGDIRIGTLAGLGKSWLSSELLNFSSKHPELKVQIQLGLHQDLVKDFENYLLDFLILPEESLPHVGERVFLSEEKITLVYPDDEKKFPITHKIDFYELLKYPTILFQKEDHLFLKWCHEHYNQRPNKLNVRVIVNSHGSMLQAVQMGLGIAVVPNHVLNRSMYKDRLKTLGTKAQVSNGKIFLLYHKGSDELLRIKKTLECLIKRGQSF